VSCLCRFPARRGRRAPRRLYNAESPRQIGHPQPHQTPDARSRPAGIAVIKFRVVNCIQSASEGSRLPFQRTSKRSSAFLYQVQRIPAAVLVVFLRGYKLLISPLLPSACRFYPTCSEYTREAVEVHGAARGLWLGLKRVARCHPFHAGGTDPVPRRSAS